MPHRRHRVDIPKLEILQGSATTYYRWEVVYRFCWKFTSLSSSERIFKIC